MKIKALPVYTLITTFSLLLLASLSQAQSIELTPQKGWQGKLMDVAISGTNTTFASASSTCGALDENKIMFHQGMTTFKPLSVVVESDVQLYSQINISSVAPTGLYDVILWPGQGTCSITCQDCFEIFPPSQITTVSPDSANINTTNLDVTISADFTCFTQGSSTCQANPGNVRFYQSGPGAASFSPNSVNIVDNNTLVANIDLPAFTVVGEYHVVVAENYPCEASCDSCFTVLADPFVELIIGNIGTRGSNTTIMLEIFFADIAACAYSPTTVYLQLGNYSITPTNVKVNGQMLTMDIAIPADAPIGDYDVIVGNGLGEPCEYICEGCFHVDAVSNTRPRPYDESSMLVYPNPNKGEFTITTANTLFDTCLEIYDATGKLILHERLGRLDDYTVQLSAKGLYIIKLATKDASMIQRIVVE